MKPLILTLSSFMAGCLLWGCATQSDVRILEDRIIALERRNLELQQQTSEAVSAKHQMKNQLEEKERALRDQSAGISATTDELKNEIQTLNGRIDELNYRISQKDKEMKTLEQRTGMAERKLDIETPAPQSAPPPSSDSASSGNTYPFESGAATAQPPTTDDSASDASADTEGLDANQLYTEGRQNFEDGQYSQARGKFQQLIRQFPNAQYADNAQFWIGESYYKERNYEQAILEYQAVIENYPNGNKVRASLLKQGFAFNNMGDTANSRLILQELIKKYPNTSEAIIAGQKLNSL